MLGSCVPRCSVVVVVIPRVDAGRGVPAAAVTVERASWPVALGTPGPVSHAHALQESHLKELDVLILGDRLMLLEYLKLLKKHKRDADRSRSLCWTAASILPSSETANILRASVNELAIMSPKDTNLPVIDTPSVTVPAGVLRLLAVAPL